MLNRPGQRSALVTLQSVLQERHQHLQSTTAKAIARRKERGIPLDDSIDWPAASAAAAANDPVKLRALLAGGMLEALDDYEPIAGYDDIKVRFIALDDEKRAQLQLAVQVAMQDRATLEGKPLTLETGKQAIGLDDIVIGKQVEFLRAAIADLQVDDSSIKLDDDNDVAALRATGALLTHLYIAARDFQGLPPGEGKRFG